MRTPSHARTRLIALTLPLLIASIVLTAAPDVSKAETFDYRPWVNQWQVRVPQAAHAAAVDFAYSGIDSYTVEVDKACFCKMNDPEHPLRFTVDVQDGKITAVTAVGYTDREGTTWGLIGAWDHVPEGSRWLHDVVPFTNAYKSIIGTPRRFPKVSAKFDPATGIPRSYSVTTAIAYDSGVRYRWRVTRDGQSVSVADAHAAGPWSTATWSNVWFLS